MPTRSSARRFILQELEDTEKDYIKDLGSIVEGYMPLMEDAKLPDELEGQDKVIWGNMQQIYEFHRDFFWKEVEKCVDNPRVVATIFLRYNKRLSHMYVKYCENKPKSDFIVGELDSFFEELRLKLGHKLQLADVLIKPVQRIMKYQLLLKDILKCTEKAGEDTSELERALCVMKVVPKAANDMMNVGRLQGFKGKITAHGALLLQDTVQMCEVEGDEKPTKFKERRVFLFEQLIIFSEILERKIKSNLSQPTYIFKNSVKLNKMSLKEESATSELHFVLVDKTPGSDMMFYVEAQDMEMKRAWITEIHQNLKMQSDLLRALQDPQRYQKECTKDSASSTLDPLVLRKMNSQPSVPKAATPATRPSSTSCDVTNSSRQLARLATRSNPAGQSASLDSPTSRLTPPTKHTRCKSVPVTPCEAPRSNEGQGGSPSLSQSTDSPGGSPPMATKQKRRTTNLFEGFRNTFFGRNKPSDGGSPSAKGPPGLSMPDLVQSSAGADRKSLKTCGSTDSDSEQESGLSARVLEDYTGTKEGEMSVRKGELVYLLAAGPANIYLVARTKVDHLIGLEGWLPSHVLGLKEGDHVGYKKARLGLKLRGKQTKTDKKELEIRAKALGKGVRILNPEYSVEVAPRFLAPLHPLVVQASDRAVLTCRVCGRPRPRVTWTGPRGQELVSDPPLDSGDVSLTIPTVLVGDTGEYTCTVANDHGTASDTASVTIVDGAISPSIESVRGEGGGIEVKWLTPQYPDSLQLTGFTLQHALKGSPTWKDSLRCQSNVTSHVMGGLTAGTAYQFRVVSNTSAGACTPGLPSDPVVCPSELAVHGESS